MTASGAHPLEYQWRINGIDRAESTNSILALTDLQVSQSGDYSITVGNASGMVTNRSEHLIVVPALITTQPKDQIIESGLAGGNPLNRIELLSIELQLEVAFQCEDSVKNLPG